MHVCFLGKREGCARPDSGFALWLGPQADSERCSLRGGSVPGSAYSFGGICTHDGSPFVVSGRVEFRNLALLARPE